MVKRIEVIFKDGFEDKSWSNFLSILKSELNLDVQTLRIASVYLFEKDLNPQDAEFIAKEILCDGLSQIYSLDSSVQQDFSLAIEVRYKPGVKDNLGDATALAIKDALVNFNSLVRSAKLYLIKGNISKEQAEKFALNYLCNSLIEDFDIFTKEEQNEFYSLQKNLFVSQDKSGVVEVIELKKDKKYLKKLSKQRLLALNLEEMMAIVKYFSKPSTIKKRQKEGLLPMPTDVELECIAQTWSEHCKHKIFNASIDYFYKVGKKVKKLKINSLFKTYILNTTKSIKKASKYILSAFSDNAGIFSLDKDWALAIKCETHNAPSALDPFGGALTGILGVNRDVLGAGLGAKPIFNTDVFCFASPFYNKSLPPKVIHPKRIFEGVRSGVEKGGNASGIPTINGSIVFDDRYLGRPLVFCGTVGLMPRKLSDGTQTHKKHIKSGDRIFMVGGRIGKDGIHGATFSSQHLDETSPTSAVQIGDPFTQKIMLDFLLESQALNLHSGLTDNGAGGLSSSVGELALLTNGAVVHLERCPLKYSGLEPWEIFLSESQERMTVAVPPAKAGDFVALAKKHNVEVSDIGEFNNSGYLKATYFGKTVLFLNLKFLHKGVPKLKLKALEFLEEKNPSSMQIELEEKENYNFEILELLSSLNITSKEWVIRQYDHEVLGMSVIKPLCGLNTSSPTDGAVVQPFFDKNLGIAVANGICPKFSDFDCYLMATNAVDEAVRNYISIGGDIEHWAALDNFCWPDPIKSETNPDGEKKLAQLVRANMGLAEISKAYSLPLISGKDSMKNDYVFGNTKISIPPTLLITLVGVVSDINTCLSSDFKNNSDSIYLLGKTYGELGGSEYAKLKGLDQKFFVAPKVRLEENLRLYKHLSKAIKNNLLNSCHDCSDGGLAIALAESCIGSDMGAFIDLSNLKELTNLDEQFLLFSESAGRFVVSVPKTKEKEFEKILNGCFFVKIGQVKKSKNLLIVCKNKTLVNLSIEDLKNNFKNTLKF